MGVQAARLGQQGFLGPRTVFEGTHGLFKAFAHSTEGNYGILTEDFGKTWFMEGITFKPYATGTMNQPYIDCALRPHEVFARLSDPTVTPAWAAHPSARTCPRSAKRW